MCVYAGLYVCLRRIICGYLFACSFVFEIALINFINIFLQYIAIVCMMFIARVLSTVCACICEYARVFMSVYSCVCESVCEYAFVFHVCGVWCA